MRSDDKNIDQLKINDSSSINVLKPYTISKVNFKGCQIELTPLFYRF